MTDYSTRRDITLVAVDCAYPELALQALQRSARALPVARAILFTDASYTPVSAAEGIEIITIEPIRSRDAYSQFVFKSLGPYINTAFTLVVQWDGFVIDGDAWADEFWNYDYIGGKWPHERGEFRVGNGGFSLRSKKLLDALAQPGLQLAPGENEDTAICQRLRPELETRYGIQFPNERVADRFAFDVARPVGPTLGFHGVFNFWHVFDQEELTAFANIAPEAIAKGLGFGALARNLTELHRDNAARALIARRLTLLPEDAQTRQLLNTLDDRRARKATAAQPTATSPANDAITPPASRNDRCPCGSGKRYKECHGLIPATPAQPAAVNVQALVDEAIGLHQRGQVNEAMQRYAQIIQLEPENPFALHFAGLGQYQANQPSAGLELMWRSLRLHPDEPEFYSNYATLAYTSGRYDEGRWAAEQALALNPQHTGALNNLGFNLRMLGATQAAADAYDRALAIIPNDSKTRWNRSFISLQLGDYASGFGDFELRLQFPQTQPQGRIPANTLMWRGEAITAGTRLLLLSEQGLGDTFMFARFIPLAQEKGFNITLATQRSQVLLLQQSFPAIQVVATGEHETQHFDYWASLWSLPAALGITLENLPAPQRYLQTAEEDVTRWQQRLNTLDGGVKRRIGLVWQGQFAGADNEMAERSLPPRLMARLAQQHPEITWVSLQYGAHAPSEQIVDFGQDIAEFTQMAALIDNLDAVISIDTGAAHLASALGASTWVLLRHAGEWRYGTGGTRCAWYPGMRLFRQDKSRLWEPVLQAVSSALQST